MKINLSKDILRYWTFVGYRIGALEFVWDSPYAEINTTHFLPMIKEISSYLPADIILDYSSFPMFMNSILNYYLRINYSIYCAILLGIAICRATLIGASKNQSHNTELKQLSKSALRMISDEVIEDKEELLEFILTNQATFKENVHTGIELLTKYSELQLNSALGNQMNNMMTQSYVFISYSSLDFSDASSIRSILENNSIKCWMAPQSIPGGSDYGECIPLAIKNCKIFLLILSEKSQNSKWVPKELDCAITYDKIIIPFHIDNSQLKSAFNFRLTNVQRIEAYRKTESACLELLNRIKSIYKL